MRPILEVRNLVTRFYSVDGVVHALNGVSFDLAEGETLAVVGESGSGKSVTMLSLVGLIPQPPGRIEAGEAIFYNGHGGQDLLKLSDKEIRQIRGGEIGFIFQDPLSSLNPTMTIGRQITEAIAEHMQVSQTEARRRAVELLAHVGISDAEARYQNYPHQFSGGMRQRVMIAIAVACLPKIVIADEPTTALDVTIQAQIIELVKRLRDTIGMAIIWISHDLGVVAGLADRVLVMYGGMVVENAPVDDLYERPQHPYTLGLLGAIPSLEESDDEPQRLVNIKGSPPNLLQELKRCPFARRCPFAFERCWQEIPPLLAVRERHEVACFYDVEKGRPRDDA